MDCDDRGPTDCIGSATGSAFGPGRKAQPTGTRWIPLYRGGSRRRYVPGLHGPQQRFFRKEPREQAGIQRTLRLYRQVRTNEDFLIALASWIFWRTPGAVGGIL